MEKAEFDKFADEYSSLLGESLGELGGDQRYFAQYKVDDVRAAVEASGDLSSVRRILDFGSGSGTSIPYFRANFPDAALTCLDVSERSLEVARERYPHEAAFLLFDGDRIPMEDDAFDVAFSACVFHHIESAQHARHLAELQRVLRPGGSLFIFEHNPLNPLTVHVVNNCPFDENAVLIRATTMKDRLMSVGFGDPRIHYRLFFPHPVRWLRPLERSLHWLPLGAQYYVHARKPVARVQ